MTIVLTNVSIVNYSQIHASTLTQNDSLPSEIITRQHDRLLFLPNVRDMQR